MMERREFIQKSAWTGLAASCMGLTFSTEATENTSAPLIKRPFDSSKDSRKDSLSIIGFGGIIVMNSEPSHARKVVAEAIDRGVNYFDVAPSYGNAEDRLGPALEPYRDRVFLACKTTRRDRDGASEELHSSLKKMRTDHFDLYQLHALSKMDELDQVLASGGALETFIKAREEGKIRHIGFSAHSSEVALAALDRFEFDSILFPFNFVCWFEGGFGPQVLEKAKQKGVARLALKALAYAPWPKEADHRGFEKCWYQPVSDPEKARLALRFTLSQEITAVIPPGEESMFRLALDIAERFQPLTEQEIQKVQELAKGVSPIFTAMS